MGAERIPVDQLIGVSWHRAWQSAAATVRLGETTDLRWVAWHSKRGPAFAYWTERAACELADRWLARGRWSRLEVAEGQETTAL